MMDHAQTHRGKPLNGSNCYGISCRAELMAEVAEEAVEETLAATGRFFRSFRTHGNSKT